MAPVVVVEGLETDLGTPRKIVAVLVGWVGQSMPRQQGRLAAAGLLDLLAVLVVLVARQRHTFLVVPVVAEDHRILPALLVLVVLVASLVVVGAAAVVVAAARTAEPVGQALTAMSSSSHSFEKDHAKTILAAA